jgi:hypothetical protein
VKSWHLVPTPAGWQRVFIELPTMRRLLGLAIVALLAVAFSGCGAFLTPPTGPGTDWPCGYDGQACGDSTCCPAHKFCNQYGGCTDSTQWPVYDARKMKARAKP